MGSFIPGQRSTSDMLIIPRIVSPKFSKTSKFLHNLDILKKQLHAKTKEGKGPGSVGLPHGGPFSHPVDRGFGCCRGQGPSSLRNQINWANLSSFLSQEQRW